MNKIRSRAKELTGKTDSTPVQPALDVVPSGASSAQVKGSAMGGGAWSKGLCSLTQDENERFLERSESPRA